MADANPPFNPYDRGSRYLLQHFREEVLAFLLGVKPDTHTWLGWLPESNLPWPGEKDRVCDTVALLRDDRAKGKLWAIPIEFQIDPDFDMPDRGAALCADLRRSRPPTDLPGDRYNVGLLVVNLRGKGKHRLSERLSRTTLEMTFAPRVANLSSVPAGKLLDKIESGKRSACLLPWIPLCRDGAAEGIIKRWGKAADQITDEKILDVLPMTQYFAEAAKCLAGYEPHFRRLKMIESQVWREWTTKAESIGETKGMAKMILRALGRLGKIPPEVEAAIRSESSPDRLNQLFDRAIVAPDLESFRRDSAT